MYDDEQPFKDYGLHTGQVIDNNDPLKQGRVQVVVPGILESGMWADVCMPGSPFANGMFVVPAVGGQVLVQFLDGDREVPVVMGGVAPPVVAGGSRSAMETTQLAKTITLENDDWVIMLGKSGTSTPYLDIKSRPNGNGDQCRIVIDFDQQIAEVSIPQSISLKTPGLLDLDGRLSQIRGRAVQEGNKPI